MNEINECGESDQCKFNILMSSLRVTWIDQAANILPSIIIFYLIQWMAPWKPQWHDATLLGKLTLVENLWK